MRYEPDMPEVLTIGDPAAAAALALPRSRAILFALVREGASVQILSARLALSLSLVHYHVRKLCRLGLVRVERTEPRAGRPVAIYRAVADCFLVRAELAHVSPSGALHAELDAYLERDAARRPPAAILYEVGEDGVPRMRRVRSGGSAAGEWWARLRLNDAEATSLAEEVRGVLGRYRDRQALGAEHLFYFALARA